MTKNSKHIENLLDKQYLKDCIEYLQVRGYIVVPPGQFMVIPTQEDRNIANSEAFDE